jgi:hypothetical protein
MRMTSIRMTPIMIGVLTCMWDPGSCLKTVTYGMVASLPADARPGLTFAKILYRRHESQTRLNSQNASTDVNGRRDRERRRTTIRFRSGSWFQGDQFDPGYGS